MSTRTSRRRATPPRPSSASTTRPCSESPSASSARARRCGRAAAPAAPRSTCRRHGPRRRRSPPRRAPARPGSRRPPGRPAAQRRSRSASRLERARPAARRDHRGRRRPHETVTAPGGWTLIRRTDNSTVLSVLSYYKVAGGSEAVSYAFGISPSARAAVQRFSLPLKTREPRASNKNLTDVHLRNRSRSRRVAPSQSIPPRNAIVSHATIIQTSCRVSRVSGVIHAENASPIDGRWKVLSVEVGGILLPLLQDAELTLADGKKTFILPDGKIETGTYKLAAKNKPAEIDSTTKGRDGVEKGIYSITAGTSRSVWHQMVTKDPSSSQSTKEFRAHPDGFESDRGEDSQ